MMKTNYPKMMTAKKVKVSKGKKPKKMKMPKMGGKASAKKMPYC